MTEGDWLVESVSTALFTTCPLPPGAFQRLTGVAPAASFPFVVTQIPGIPMKVHAPGGARFENGPYGDGYLWLTEATPRARLQIALTSAAAAGKDGPYHIGELATQLPRIQELTLKLIPLLEHPGTLARIGLGASLLHPVADLPSGYEWLRSHGFLPFKPDAEVVDFMYRANRPAPPSARMPAAHRLRSVSVVSIRGSLVACRLDIDINTNQSQHLSIQGASSEEILRQFAAWILDIANRGDVS